MSILVDSDVLVEISRGRDQGLLSHWENLSGGEVAVACSPVTVAEIWHGARPHEYLVLSALFESVAVIPIDLEVGLQAGSYLRKYAKSHSVELGDALIAATASVHHLALWTRNRKHYPMKDVAFHELGR